MLFKTVYGPELESIYRFLSINGAYEKDALYRYYLPIIDEQAGKRTNMDDAMNFLLASGAVEKDETGKFKALNGQAGFRLIILNNLRDIQMEQRAYNSVLDPWYMKLVEDEFIRPDKRILFNLHQYFNTLKLPEVLSEEKVNAWKRVMEFLGIGIRMFGGFFCVYRLDLVEDLITTWDKSEGPLQSFLEEGVSPYLPWQNLSGDIADALLLPLLELEKKDVIRLEQRQDLPNRAYGGEYQLKWMSKGGAI